MTIRLFSQAAFPPPEGFLDSYQGLHQYLQALWTYVILCILSTAFLGIFTILVVCSTIVLARRGVFRVSTLILVATMYTMYASTVVFWVTYLLNAIGHYEIVQAYMTQYHCQSIYTADPFYQAFLVDRSGVDPTSCTHLSYGLPAAYRALSLCASTTILIINVVLGDAIVWWRVWVIWPDSLIVRMLCVLLLSATLIMGIMDMNDSCPASVFAPLTVSNLGITPDGALFQKDLFGLTASSLSLATNFVATALIWCKAWEHRKLIASVNLGRSSRVEQILSVLVESGAVYCVIWMAVVAYQVAWAVQGDSVSAREQQFLTVFDYFLRGCLVPLVGMYPTAIILLVALNKSPFDGGSFSLPSRLRGGPSTHVSFNRHTRTTATKPTSSFQRVEADEADSPLPPILLPIETERWDLSTMTVYEKVPPTGSVVSLHERRSFDAHVLEGHDVQDGPLVF